MAFAGQAGQHVLRLARPVGDGDLRPGLGEPAGGGSADATGAADDQDDLAVHGAHLMGGCGSTDSPGSITNVYSKVYQGAWTSGAGGVPASWR